jgi:YbbR domain-containing protein
MRSKLRDFFSDNLSYKLVALFIALILWLTILGRRDFVLQKSIDLEVLTSTKVSVLSQSAESVKIKVSGPRAALKKFVDSPVSQVLTIDATGKNGGSFELEVPVHRLDLPFGVKVIKVQPSKIQVKLEAK